MPDAETRRSVIKRLRLIEGQVRGVAGMVEAERYCIEVLHQIHAIRAALRKVEDEMLKSHAATCVASAVASGDAEAQRRKVDELVDLLTRRSD